MKLVDLLNGMDYEVIKGEDKVNINKLEYDSRKIVKGDVFVCIKGFNVDGHNYAKSAVQMGALALICSENVDIDKECTIIKVKDTRKALAIAAANFYENPVDKIKLIGVTGTNGKTTSTYMIKSILDSAGYKTGVIGTIANYIKNERIKSDRTTPESLELHKLFKLMVDSSVEYCIMEVSSHSLDLNRVYGIKFSEAIFTNLTQDHLDFHKTFENYYKAKLKLFKNAESCIINLDDLYGQKIIDDISKDKNILTYSLEDKGTLEAKDIINSSRGVEFNLYYGKDKVHINLNIPGRYNVYNALASAGACIQMGISLDKIKKGFENVIVPGRCEIATKGYNLDFDVIIDYAHTPDGLENILKTAREFTKGRLISVFGCGGDRDKTKRPIMGKIGSDLSDIAIITSDNPRTEEPMSIIEDIIKGIDKDNYLIVENRKNAIKKAMEIAKEDDVIVVAGKGHEDYQILKDKVIHFDEREVISDIIKELF